MDSPSSESAIGRVAGTQENGRTHLLDPEKSPGGLGSVQEGKSTSKSTTAETDYTTITSDTGTAPIPFTSVARLLHLLESSTDVESISVNGVSVEGFLAIDESRQAKGRKYRFFYDGQTKLLIITFPTLLHEVMHRWLDDRVLRKVGELGLADDLRSVGAATYQSLSGGTLQASLEGDSCRAPSSRIAGRRWPVLVIEAGYSQTMTELRSKARTWFRASDFDVKIVILVKMAIRDGVIVLEKWKSTQAGGEDRPGMRMTRARSRRVPECVHTIHISRSDLASEGPASPESYRVARGALILEFKELFLRSANGEEGDIIITEEELQLFASQVWPIAT
jgi:hypothetical protein